MTRVLWLILALALVLGAGQAEAAFPTNHTADKSSGANGSATDQVLNLPANIDSGNLIICGLATNSTPTSTWPTGWDERIGDTNNGTVFSYRVRSRVADGTEGASITVTLSASNAATYICLRISGQHDTSAPEATNANGSDSNPNPPSLDPAGCEGPTRFSPPFRHQVRKIAVRSGSGEAYRLTLSHTGVVIGAVGNIRLAAPGEVYGVEGACLTAQARLNDSVLAAKAWAGMAQGIFTAICAVTGRLPTADIGTGELLEVALTDVGAVPNARITQLWIAPAPRRTR